MNERISIADKNPEVKSYNHVPQIRRKTESFQSKNSPVDRILFLQRTIGNQAVGKLIKSGALQAKLRIGQSNDIYEQEANKVAEHVMGMPDVSSGKGTSVQRKCPKCLKGLRTLLGKDKKDEKLQAKEAFGYTPEVTQRIEANVNALRDNGQPLSESTRAFFEPRFGHNFSHVRVHTDAKASESAKEVNAQAYTVGQDVVFGAGQYTPSTTDGGRLLAHELTHVLQQQRTVNNLKTKFPASKKEGVSEIGVDPTTDAVMSRKVSGIFAESASMIQRTCGVNGIATAVAGGVCTDSFDKTLIAGSPPFKFKINCDDFVLGQDKALQKFAGGLPATTTIQIHGYASTDGPPAFNQNLGCARALKAQSVLITPDPGTGFAGIAPTRITGIINHGPVPGPVADRRSVVIRTTASAPTPPTPVPPTPSAPTCVPRTGITEYGCYCGRGTSCPVGHTCAPIDALDACCQAHDICYTACSCEFEDSINPFSSRNAAARACDSTLCRCARGLTLTGRAATYRDRMLRVFRC